MSQTTPCKASSPGEPGPSPSCRRGPRLCSALPTPAQQGPQAPGGQRQCGQGCLLPPCSHTDSLVLPSDRERGGSGGPGPECEPAHREAPSDARGATSSHPEVPPQKASWSKTARRLWQERSGAPPSSPPPPGRPGSHLSPPFKESDPPWGSTHGPRWSLAVGCPLLRDQSSGPIPPLQPPRSGRWAQRGPAPSSSHRNLRAPGWEAVAGSGA